MAGAVELATAYIALVPSLKGASQKISDELNPAAASSGASAGDNLGRSIIGTAAKWAAPLAAAVGFGAVIKSGFDEAKDAAAGTAQLAAGIASTGNAANLSVDGLNSLASEIQNYSGQTDDSIVKSEQLLQTFTNIKNTGPDKIFDMATKASADMAAKFGGDASSQAVVLGKALNDPVKGITALTRVGVTFTDEQKKTIDAMVKTGDVAGAQKVILGELNTEFGGAAKAAGQSFPGQLQRVHRAFEDLSQGIVQGFLPVMGPALEGIIKILQKVGPAAAEGAQKVADKTAAIGGAIKGVFELFKTGDFNGGIRKALGLEEDSPIIGAILGIRGGITAMFAAYKAGDGDVTSSGFAGFMERVGGAFAIASEGASVFFDGLKTGSNGAEGGLDGLAAKVGNGIHNSFLVASEGASVFWDGLKTGSNGATGGIDGIASRIGNTLNAVFTGIGPLIAQLGPIIMPLIPQFLSLLSSISPIQTVFQAIAPFLPQLLGVFGQLAAVVGQTLGTALTTIVPLFGQLQGVFIQVFQQLLATALPVVVQLVTMLGQTFAHLLPILMPIVVQVATLAMTLVSQLAPIFMQLVSAVLPMVVTIFGAILGAIGPLITILAGLLIPIIQALMPVVMVVFTSIASIITAVMQIIMGIVQVVTGIISGNWSMVWEGISNIFSGIWNGIVVYIGYFVALFFAIISGGLGLVSGFIGSILGNIGQFFADTWNNITRGISDFVGGIGKFFAGIPDAIMGALSGAGSWLFDAGKNIVEGLFNGIKSLAGTIGNFFLGLLPGWIVDPFKIALGIQSPSKLFRQFGRHIGEGLMLGTGDTKDDIGASMRDLVTVPDMPVFAAGTASIGRPGRGNGVTNNWTINQVDDPIGTAHAIARRQTALAV
jgi:phage-related protein